MSPEALDQRVSGDVICLCLGANNFFRQFANFFFDCGYFAGDFCRIANKTTDVPLRMRIFRSPVSSRFPRRMDGRKGGAPNVTPGVAGREQLSCAREDVVDGEDE